MWFTNYLRFAAANRRFVGFGFLVMFSATYGQTHFIGIFGPSVQAEFALSHTEWGSIYLAGTLASAMVLPWSGRLIDRLDLRLYTVIVSALAVVACLTMSLSVGVTSLVVAIFLLRHSGQGLLSHIAMTSMARYFEAGRGRALAIAVLGSAAGQAFLPFVAVLVIATIGWRWTYAAMAVVLAGGFAPFAFWLLRDHRERHRVHVERSTRATTTEHGYRRSWTRAEMLRDVRFYLMVPGLLAASVIVTALFFHHLNLADSKGWSHAWLTGSYGIYALATVFTALACGPLIDRFGAVRLMRIMLLPLIASMLLVAQFDGGWVVWPYLILMAVSSGVEFTALSAMWAEIYGLGHLGAIKSFAAALSVFGSALGPVTVGVLIDYGLSIEQVCQLFAGGTVLAAALLAVALSLPAPRLP